MNDTLRIANDSLKVVLSSTNGAQNSSATTWEDIIYLLCVIVILVVIAEGFYFTVRIILESIERSRENSLKHEEKMHDLNRTKEERKQLLDFCYDMAKKKESETKDFIKKTTTTVKKNTTDAKTSIEKEEKSTLVTNTMMEGENAGGNTEKTITLDQIRHECWQIIKQKNEIKI